MPKSKAPGHDEIRPKEILALSEPALKVLHSFLLAFWRVGKVPESLKICILVPFLKDSDGDNHDPSNFRPIALIPFLTKIYQSIILRRLT